MAIELRDPHFYFLQRGCAERVYTFTTAALLLDETEFAENAKMLGYRRSTDAEVFAQRAHRLSTAAKKTQDLSSRGVVDGRKNIPFDLWHWFLPG